jgi:hypothetical protein
MGGYGSGKRYGAKRRVEESLSLTCSWLLQRGFFDLCVGKSEHHTITWNNYRGVPVYNLVIEIECLRIDEVRLYLFSSRQAVHLRPTPQRFGGLRWWFACPGCWRRCAKLYLPRQASVFLCRLCHDLSYVSCIEGKSMTAFLAATSAGFGMTVAETRKAIREDTRARNKWRRRRDRRTSYRGRGRSLPGGREKSLKRTILEAKVASDMARTLRKIGVIESQIDGY